MTGSASDPRQLTKITKCHQNYTNKQRFYLPSQRQDYSLVLSDFSLYNNITSVNLQPQQPKYFTHSFLTTLPAHTCTVNNYCSNIMTLWYFACLKYEISKQKLLKKI